MDGTNIARLNNKNKRQSNGIKSNNTRKTCNIKQKENNTSPQKAEKTRRERNPRK